MKGLRSIVLDEARPLRERLNLLTALGLRRSGLYAEVLSKGTRLK